jgi:hypothetical protein
MRPGKTQFPKKSAAEMFGGRVSSGKGFRLNVILREQRFLD